METTADRRSKRAALRAQKGGHLLGKGIRGVVVGEGKSWLRTEGSRELGCGAQSLLQVDKSMSFRIKYRYKGRLCYL